MKMVSITCPNCNGKLDFDLDDTKIYCPYCGHKLMIDYEEMSKLYIEKENTKQEQEKTKRIELETNYKKKRLIFAGIVCIVAIMGFTAYLLSSQLSDKTVEQVACTQESSPKQPTHDIKAKNTVVPDMTAVPTATSTVDLTATPTPKVIEKENKMVNEIPDDFSLSITSFDGSGFSKTYTDGTYKVGSDIPAGKYGAFNTGSGTGYAILYEDSTKSNQLDGGGWSNYFCFVNIKEGQLLEVTGLALVPYEDIEAKGSENYGIFVGGDTLPVGEYYLTRIDTSKKGLYSVYSDTAESDVLEYDYYPKSAFLTVKEGQIVVLQNTNAVKAPKEPVNITTVSNEQFDSVYPENMYRIGIDIDAGTYVAYGPQKWTSSINVKPDSGATKDIDYYPLNCCEILDLKNGIVDVNDGSYLVKYDKVKSLSSDITGIYIVGENMDVGEYKIVPDISDNSHYWAIYNVNNEFSLSMENYIKGNDYITLTEGQAFVIQNATFEKQ